MSKPPTSTPFKYIIISHPIYFIKTFFSYTHTKKSNRKIYCFFMQLNYLLIFLKLFVPCEKPVPETFPYYKQPQTASYH